MEHRHFQSGIHLQSGSMFYCDVRNQLGGFPPHLPWRSPRRRHDRHGFFRHRNAWTRAFGRFLSAGRQCGWLCDYPPRNKHLRTRKWMVEIRSFPFGMVHFQGLTVSFREGTCLAFSYRNILFTTLYHSLWLCRTRCLGVDFQTKKNHLHRQKPMKGGLLQKRPCTTWPPVVTRNKEVDFLRQNAEFHHQIIQKASARL